MKSTANIQNIVLVVGEQALGSGGFSNVYKGRLNAQPVAIKVPNEQVADATTKYELLLHKRLTHPNILQFIMGVQYNNKLCIVTEFMPEGDLYEALVHVDGKLSSVSVCKQIGAGILDGLDYLHQNKILHQDLKPENILLSTENGQWCAKIADFGHSTFISEKPQGLRGTFTYLAPEHMQVAVAQKELQVDVIYTTQSDIYALGLIFYVLFFRGSLFSREQPESELDFFARVLNHGPLPLPEMPVSEMTSLIPVVQSCISHTPNERLSLAAIKECIFFKPAENSTDTSAAKDPTSRKRKVESYLVG